MPNDQDQTAALIAAKRAEVLAKLAKFQKPGGATGGASPAAASSSSASPTPPRASSGSPLPGPSSSTQGGPQLDVLQKKIAEAKARLANSVSAMPRATASGIHTPDTEGKWAAKPHIATDESGHIDLKAMLDSIPRRDVATAKANLRQAARKDARKTPERVEKKAPVINPYLANDPEVAKVAPLRKPRQLKFAQPGKYIQQAQEVRRKAQLEKLKEEIAQSVKKAGMEVELDITDKTLKKEPPPPAEWWDAPFLPNKTYEDMDQTPVIPEQLDQLITLYVHHPIPIKPPNEQNETPIVRSLMLTKKERKKLRRQRRQEAQKEKQDKIRLGLLPPDPPKVKISNLMRVLGNEAIQDPTKIEAKVRKEMEQRQKQHELANAQRKLTPEERRAKILNKMKEDQKMSNEVAVFKVKNCSHPKHKYKIQVNAEQYKLTGMVIIHPKCHLVIVEGGPKSIKAYKKLMLRRIDWNDMPPPKNGEAMDIDLTEDNRCFLVWEGQVKEKAFKKFTWKTFESEKMAREELSKWNVEHYWDAAVLHSDEDLAARQPML